MTLKQNVGKWIISKLPVNRRTFDILRFEFGCLLQRVVNFASPRYHKRVFTIRHSKDLSVNFGSGGHGQPGWINIDARSTHKDQYISLDLRRPLPFRNGQVKRIFAEHVIEHLDFRDDIPQVFSEFYRILAIGGTVRVIVPDVERYLRAYVESSAEQFAALGWNLESLPNGIYTKVHIINHVFHQGGEHLFGWDFETMKWALDKAGFRQILRQSYQVSSDPELAIDQPNHAPYSLYVEAIK